MRKALTLIGAICAAAVLLPGCAQEANNENANNNANTGNVTIVSNNSDYDVPTYEEVIISGMLTEADLEGIDYDDFTASEDVMRMDVESGAIVDKLSDYKAKHEETKSDYSSVGEKASGKLVDSDISSIVKVTMTRDWGTGSESVIIDFTQGVCCYILGDDVSSIPSGLQKQLSASAKDEVVSAVRASGITTWSNSLSSTEKESFKICFVLADGREVAYIGHGEQASGSYPAELAMLRKSLTKVASGE